jgi:hypothetical protein
VGARQPFGISKCQKSFFFSVVKNRIETRRN